MGGKGALVSSSAVLGIYVYEMSMRIKPAGEVKGCVELVGLGRVTVN